MKDIVEFIVKQFVSNPDAVEVTEQSQDGYLNILLKVAPEDMGLTIGKSGQTIKAIRRLLTIKAISENMRVNLELVDSGIRPEQTQNDNTPSLQESENSENQKTGESESQTSETPASDESENSDIPSPSEPETQSEDAS
jgi:uncharacterized protein